MMDGNQSAEETDSHTPKPPVEASDGMNGFFRAKSRTLIAKNRTLKNIMSSTPKQKQQEKPPPKKITLREGMQDALEQFYLDLPANLSVPSTFYQFCETDIMVCFMDCLLKYFDSCFGDLAEREQEAEERASLLARRGAPGGGGGGGGGGPSSFSSARASPAHRTPRRPGALSPFAEEEGGAPHASPSRAASGLSFRGGGGGSPGARGAGRLPSRLPSSIEASARGSPEQQRHFGRPAHSLQQSSLGSAAGSPPPPPAAGGGEGGAADVGYLKQLLASVALGGGGGGIGGGGGSPGWRGSVQSGASRRPGGRRPPRLSLRSSSPAAAAASRLSAPGGPTPRRPGPGPGPGAAAAAFPPTPRPVSTGARTSPAQSSWGRGRSLSPEEDGAAAGPTGGAPQHPAGYFAPSRNRARRRERRARRRALARAYAAVVLHCSNHENPLGDQRFFEALLCYCGSAVRAVFGDRRAHWPRAEAELDRLFRGGTARFNPLRAGEAAATADGGGGAATLAPLLPELPPATAAAAPPGAPPPRPAAAAAALFQVPGAAGRGGGGDGAGGGSVGGGERGRRRRARALLRLAEGNCRAAAALRGEVGLAGWRLQHMREKHNASNPLIPKTSGKGYINSKVHNKSPILTEIMPADSNNK